MGTSESVQSISVLYNKSKPSHNVLMPDLFTAKFDNIEFRGRTSRKSFGFRYLVKLSNTMNKSKNAESSI